MGQQALHSLTLGSIYALLGVGCTLMYATHRVLYLAYGGLYALGGYVAWWTIRANYTIWGAFTLAIVLCALVGILSHWLLRTGLPRASETSRLLTGLGLLICIEELCRLGIGPHHLKVIAIDSHQVHTLGPLMVTDVHWIVFGGTFALLTTVQGFLSASRFGRGIYTLLQDASGVSCCYQSRRWLQGVTSGLGAALAGVSGVLAGLYLNDVYPAIGTAITHKILALVLIGTLGSLRGAILAAYVFALIEGVLLPATRLPIPSEVALLVALALVSGLGPRGVPRLPWSQKG